MAPNWRNTGVLLTVIVGAGVLVPAPDQLLLTRAAVWAMLAISTWLLLRVSGRSSLGNAAFLGVAAYGTGLASTRLEVDNFWVAAVVAIAASTVAGLVVGLISGRLSGFHFLLITLAFAEMLRALATRWSFLGGEDGIAGISRPSTWPLGLDLTEPEAMMWFTSAALFVVVGALAVFLRSSFGAIAHGVRDSPTRMAALGYAPVRYRASMVAVASSIAGLAGVLNAYAVRFVSPTDLAPLVSAKALLYSVIGGASVAGAAITAIAMTFLENDLSSRFDRWLSVLGLTYIGIVIVGTDWIRAFWRPMRVRIAPYQAALLRRRPRRTDVTGHPAKAAPTPARADS